MIYIGLSATDKARVIRDRMPGYRKTYIFVADKYPGDLDLSGDFEIVTYSEVILYRFFYRLLGEIGRDSLIIVNEFIKTKKRSDLTYNCLAKYINQAGEILVFNFAPLISEEADFMILQDMETRGQSRLASFSREFWKGAVTSGYAPALEKIALSTGKAERKGYAELKDKLFANLGEQAPHIIPRRLHLYTGTIKAKVYAGGIICRNKRMKRAVTYDEIADKLGIDAAICDFPYVELDFWKYLYVTRPERVKALVADGLPVDDFYFDHYEKLIKILADFNVAASLFA
jgi:hypothetical protein